MGRLVPLILTVLLVLSPAVLAAGEDNPVRVGVIDSGILATHPALKDVSIEQGENFVFPDTATKDLLGHGTRISHLIAKESPTVTLVPLVVASRYPSGVQTVCSPDSIAKAIVAAIDHHKCQILNLSIGVPYDSPSLREAVEYAEDQGVLIVAAAGNSGETNPEAQFFPAAYDTVVSVGAVDSDGVIAPFSQKGYTCIYARGVDVEVIPFGFSIVPPKVSGTSYAAATITGIAAELLHQNPDWTTQELRDALRDLAQNNDDTYDTHYECGIVS